MLFRLFTEEAIQDGTNGFHDRVCGAKCTFHYENMPMQYTAIMHSCKNDNFQMKNCNVFIFLLKTLIVGTR